MLPSDLRPDQIQEYFDLCILTLHANGMTVEQMNDVVEGDYALPVNKRIYLMFLVAWANLPLSTAMIMFDDVEIADSYVEELLAGVKSRQTVNIQQGRQGNG